MAKQYNSSQRGGIKGNTVAVDGDFNKALRKFKKRVEESGVLQDYLAKQFYTTPSEKRKRAKGAAKARWLKKVRNEQLPKKLY